MYVIAGYTAVLTPNCKLQFFCWSIILCMQGTDPDLKTPYKDSRAWTCSDMLWSFSLQLVYCSCFWLCGPLCCTTSQFSSDSQECSSCVLSLNAAVRWLATTAGGWNLSHHALFRRQEVDHSFQASHHTSVWLMWPFSSVIRNHLPLILWKWQRKRKWLCWLNFTFDL